jgi:hypothetical protein
MSLKHPQTPAEWRAHIDTLDAEDLWNKAADANSARFVRTLIDEGYGPKEIEGIFVALAKRFVVLGQRPPEGGWYDLPALAQGRTVS